MTAAAVAEPGAHAARPGAAAGAPGSELHALLAGAADFLGADQLVAFVWRDDRTAVVRAAHPPLPDAAAPVLSVDRAAVVAAGGVALELAVPRRFVSSALQPALAGRPTAAWVAAANDAPDGARPDGGASPVGGLLAVWCGGAPDPALADPGRFARLRAAVAGALRADAAASAVADVALRFDAIMAAVPQAVVFVDDQAGAGLVNAAAAALLGVPEGPVDPSRLAARMAALRAGAEVRPAEGAAGAERWVWHLGGPAPRTLRVAALPVTRDGSRGRLWMFDDVTREAAAADALRAGEARARAAEARFRAALEASPDACYLFEAVRAGDGRVVDFLFVEANAGAEALYGLPPGSLVGRTLCDLFPVACGGELFERFAAVVATGTPHEGEYRTRDPRARAGRVWLQAAALRGEDGATVGLAVTARDVTAARAAEEERAREREFLGAVLESLAEAVVACDADGRLTLFNRAAREFHGLPASGAVPPERWAEHYRLHRADGATPLPADEAPLARALRGEVVRGAEMVVAVEGRPPRAVAANGQRFVDRAGRSLGAVVALHDVSERVEADRRKSEFVATVSHELRTPLTSIRGSLGLLEAGVVGALPEKAAPLVRIAGANVERLVRLVNDVLDLEKIEAGKLEYAMAAQDPADVVGAAADGIAGLAAAARVEVVARVETRAAVLGDRDRLLQVLTNLLSNAIKFSPPHSAVAVRASDHADAAGRPAVRFAVEDYGPGIPADRLALLFQKFRQLGVTEATRRGGTGLGLAITKAIVEQHGGRVGVASEPGRRTVFWCDLPARPAGQR